MCFIQYTVVFLYIHRYANLTFETCLRDVETFCCTHVDNKIDPYLWAYIPLGE